MVRLALLLLLVVVLAGGYSAYTGNRVFEDLGSGRDYLMAGQTNLDAAIKNADPASAHQAALELAAAAANFQRGSDRLSSDPALRVAAVLPGSRHQVEAVAHLATIGRYMSQAGAAAEQIAEGVIRLRQLYGGRTLFVADVAALARDADALAQRYATAAAAVGEDLRAAHHERAGVTTTALVAPLRAVYDQVDEALAQADAAFIQFQDPKRILDQLFGLTLPA